VAAELIELFAFEEAIDHLNRVVRDRIDRVVRADSLAHFELGRAYEGLEQRERPSAAHTIAAARPPRDDPDRVRTHVRDIRRDRSRRCTAR
jgi:hypothetical protein